MKERQKKKKKREKIKNFGRFSRKKKSKKHKQSAEVRLDSVSIQTCNQFLIRLKKLLQKKNASGVFGLFKQI